MLAAIIDFAALWKILVTTFAVGVGLTAVYGAGAAAAARIGRGSTVANGALVAVAGLICVAALVLGLYAMTKK
jgi:hypothetical protein